MQQDLRTVAKQLVALSLPIMGVFLMRTITLVVDFVMCGHVPDAGVSLTALSFAVQLWFLLSVAAMGMTIGVVATVARAFGADDHERVNHIVAQSIQFAVLVGAAIGIGAGVFADPLLRALGASPTVAAAGTTYMRPVMFGLPIMFLTEALSGALRGVRHTRLPFTTGLIANLINIVLNYCLILGNFGFPALGVFGAGLGTMISWFVGLALLVIYLRRGAVANFFLRFRLWRIDRALGLQLFRVGAPAVVEKVAFFGTMLGLVWMLAQVDELAVGAHGVGNRVFVFVLVPIIGIAGATGAFTGNALGAGSIEQARRVARISITLSLTVSLAFTGILLAAVHQVVAIFDMSSGSALAEYSILWLRLMTYSLVPTAIYTAIAAVLQGAGATKTVMRINIFVALAVQIPLAASLGFYWDYGAFGIWLSQPLAILPSLALGYFAYTRERWAVTGLAAAAASE